MPRKVIQGFLGGLLWAAALCAAAPAFAQTTAAGPVYPGMLIRGGAALPQFQLEFPNLTPALNANGSSGNNLEIALTSPDKSVFSFLFSPRAQFGTSLDRATGQQSNFAGMSWNVFDRNSFYGGLGLTAGVLDANSDPLRRNLGSPLALHSTLQFGYRMAGEQSLLLSLDHANTPDFSGDHGELGENLRLDYGVKF
jgi:hypothetical protein